MKRRFFYLSLLFVMFGLGMAFQTKDYFWCVFPIVQGGILAFTLFIKNASINKLTFKDIRYGILSGILLYVLFALGKIVVITLFPTLFNNLLGLYELIQPRTWWHTLLVFMIIIPAEEMFWRGFVQQKLRDPTIHPVLISSSLYALAHLASGSLLLVLSALLAGFVWGFLYVRSQNILVPLLSHLVFDLLLFIIFPLL
ncbi:CPBP family intramembrane glutamic endopeptidase [Pseudalkalibacillus decolorationis]|uniref:CPBP family intramembrane glutamic endopeptidase n=1 Tax=Pseudalkalibacillus decolorationis TaxID=163879 RepID=UPI00214726BD|nr:CPBP family intramembrane glutamic endopeptidase [Pseudalkalibacillus decolorationis]